MATEAPPRSLRALMAAREIYTLSELARRAKVQRNQLTLMAQGWTGTPAIVRRLAKALGVDVAAINEATSHVYSKAVAS